MTTVAKPEKAQLKITVIVDEDVAQLLEVERERIAKAEGFKVSMTQLASAAIKRGFSQMARPATA